MNAAELFESQANCRSHLPALIALTSEVPWPLNSGGHIRTFHMLKALTRRFCVRLISPATVEDADGIEKLTSLNVTVCGVPVKSRTAPREVLKVVSAAASSRPYVLYQRHNHQLIRERLIAEVERQSPCGVYLDHLDSFVYNSAVENIPIILDLHNIYSKLTERVAQEQGSVLRRLYLRREARLLGRMERIAARRSNLLLTVSADEQRYFQSVGAVATRIVPNGVDCSAYASSGSASADGPPTILYVGDMSWQPNIDAAEFLAKTVLPAVATRVADVRFQIVGRNPSSRVRALQSDLRVVVTGGVPDVRPYLQDAHVLAVPLGSGGGTRLKILESFAAGLPVVSTAVGCEGILAQHADHLIIAERDEMAGAVTTVISDRKQSLEMAQRAKELVVSMYDWDSIGELACDAVESVVL